MASPRGYALFDLDYTLIPQDTLLLLCNYILRRHRSRMLYLLIFLPVVPFAALGLIGSRTLKRIFLAFLRGLRRPYINAVALDFTRRCVIPRIYPELRAEIERHKKEGRITVLNTASPEFYAHHVAAELGFDHVRATPVVLPEVMPWFPVIDGPNNKRYAKIERMMDVLPSAVQIALGATPQSNPARPDYPAEAILKNSWSYSDSPADLPLLRLTENAALVHPEKASLIEEGRRKGWTVMHPLRPYGSVAGKWWHALRQILGLYPD